MTKRPHMPVSVQRDAALIALGLDPNDVEWHHQPALALRLIDIETGKYTPDANDPRYIVPLATKEHRERTAKIDIPQAAKTKRLEKAQEAFRAAMVAKTTGDDPPRDVKRHRIPSRPFQKGKRPMSGRYKTEKRA